MCMCLSRSSRPATASKAFRTAILYESLLWRLSARELTFTSWQITLTAVSKLKKVKKKVLAPFPLVFQLNTKMSDVEENLKGNTSSSSVCLITVQL